MNRLESYFQIDFSRLPFHFIHFKGANICGRMNQHETIPHYFYFPFSISRSLQNRHQSSWHDFYRGELFGAWILGHDWSFFNCVIVTSRAPRAWHFKYILNRSRRDWMICKNGSILFRLFIFGTPSIPINRNKRRNKTTEGFQCLKAKKFINPCWFPI